VIAHAALGVALLIVQVTQQDVDASLAARGTESRCESDGTPLALALHRDGYLTNATDDSGALVGATHDQAAARWYSMTTHGAWLQHRVCVNGERIGPYVAVLVADAPAVE
jgi:hypothetical protein